jgi:hypothetical protein
MDSNFRSRERFNKYVVRITLAADQLDRISGLIGALDRIRRDRRENSAPDPKGYPRSKSRGRDMISSGAPIGRLFFGGVLSFDPQPVFFVPVLDREFGIAVEAVVIGADLRFDPARFVAQQQMHARGRLR